MPKQEGATARCEWRRSRRCDEAADEKKNNDNDITDNDKTKPYYGKGDWLKPPDEELVEEEAKTKWEKDQEEAHKYTGYGGHKRYSGTLHSDTRARLEASEEAAAPALVGAGASVSEQLGRQERAGRRRIGVGPLGHG